MINLIRMRSKVDGTYAALHTRQTVTGATDMATLYEPVFLTYVDLDRLIDEAPLSSGERTVVTALMEGYTIGDIAEEMNCAMQTVDVQMCRAASKIAKQNDLNWARTYEKKKICDSV